MMHVREKLGLWLVHFGQVVGRRRERKYLPIKESDYPIRNKRYMAFENRVGRVFPRFVEPNYLTFARIIICIVLLIPVPELSYLSLLIMTIIGGLSDFFDGALARARAKKTQFGVMLDPLADKLLVFTVLFILTTRGDIRLVYILCMALCETHILLIPMLSYGYQWKQDVEHRPCSDGKDRVQPVSFGRVKLHFYVYAVLLMIIGRMIGSGMVVTLGGWLLVMGISAAAIALFQYVYRWVLNPY
jgi:phosphatidylglycerophosphate synthase